MVAKNKDIAQLSIVSTILIFVSMLIFPDKFGMGLASSSLTFSMFEIVFYGIVFYIFRRNVTLIQLFAGAGLTFLYRVVLGTIFGMILSLYHGMDFSVSLTLGVSRYLPAIFLHIAAAPFLMKPFFVMILNEQSTSQKRRMPPPKPVSQKKNDSEWKPATHKPKPAVIADIDVSSSVNYNTNGFERAVKYIGEHRAVLVAAVVDHEGLLMASFKRDFGDPEHWSAYSLLIQKVNDDLLSRSGRTYKIDNIDLSFETNRLTIERVDNFNLLVLSNNEEDDLLKIRLAQGADMIRKYSSERYGSILSAGTEEKYVSST